MPFSNSLIHLNLKPSGEIDIDTDSIELGPFNLYTSMNMPLLSPDDWGDGPSISLTIQAASHVSGMLNGCSLVLTKNSPWTVTLELPDSGIVPSFTNGFNLVQPPSSIHLSDPGSFTINDLFDYVPGMILDSAIGILNRESFVK